MTGGVISEFDKFVQIGNEPEPVYHISRIAGHAGFGSAIGTLTAPVSIPTYIYWQKKTE